MSEGCDAQVREVRVSAAEVAFHPGGEGAQMTWLLWHDETSGPWDCRGGLKGIQTNVGLNAERGSLIGCTCNCRLG